MAIGDDIARLREQAGLTRNDLAEKTGLPVDQLYLVETKGQPPSEYALQTIEECLRRAGLPEADVATLHATVFAETTERLVVPEPPWLAQVTWLSAAIWVPLPIALVGVLGDAAFRNRLGSDLTGVASLAGLIAVCLVGVVTSLLVRKRKGWARGLLMFLYGTFGLLGLVNLFVAYFMMGLELNDRRVVGNVVIGVVAGFFNLYFQQRKVDYYVKGVTRAELRADMSGQDPSKALAAVWALAAAGDERSITLLGEALTHDDPAVKKAATEALSGRTDR